MERTKMEQALQGARICLAHWLVEGDAELARDAQGQLERLAMAARGETPEWWDDPRQIEADLGAADWLDTDPTHDLEGVAVAGLVAAWDAMVAEGEMDEMELAQSLAEQADGGCQGWDSSMEDAESHPELALLVGLDPESEDDQDEAMEAWGRVVGEAARQWLRQHELTKEDQHEAALAAWRRADAMAEELYAVGLEELADKMWEMGQAARQAAADLERAMGYSCTV